MSSRNISTLIDGCEELGISLTGDQAGMFDRYYGMLIEKNKVMNLTAITQWEDVITKHFLDSLLVCRVYDLDEAAVCGLHMLDMGSGAGFPGIPLGIAFPGLQITLADSLQKRVRFLEDVIGTLQLEGILAVHARAEDLGRMPGYREQYDLVVSRAVANLSSLCEYCLPFVKPGGMFISYKSTDIDMEYAAAASAISKLGGEAEGITTLPLPQTDLQRSFVRIRKVRPTLSRYPRKAGTPSKDPL